MSRQYRGVHLIVDRQTGRITAVQVASAVGDSFPMPLVDYIDRDVEPVQYGTYRKLRKRLRTTNKTPRSTPPAGGHVWRANAQSHSPRGVTMLRHVSTVARWVGVVGDLMTAGEAPDEFLLNGGRGCYDRIFRFVVSVPWR